LRKLFVSYARENRRDVGQLVEHLELMGYDTWVDTELRGGQDWWEEVLRRIADSDVFVAIISRAALTSTACQRECDWAEALARPVLPVAVEPTPTALPRRLARRQIIDYSQPQQRDRAALKLQGGLGAVPPAPPLPEPLPEPPAAPLSYLTDLIDLVSQAGVLNHDQQRHVLNQLEPALRSIDHEERRGGSDILDMLSSRGDLYADVDRTIIRLRSIGDVPASFRSDDRDSTEAADKSPEREAPAVFEDSGEAAAADLPSTDTASLAGRSDAPTSRSSATTEDRPTAEGQPTDTPPAPPDVPFFRRLNRRTKIVLAVVAAFAVVATAIVIIVANQSSGGGTASQTSTTEFTAPSAATTLIATPSTTPAVDPTQRLLTAVPSDIHYTPSEVSGLAIASVNCTGEGLPQEEVTYTLFSDLATLNTDFDYSIADRPPSWDVTFLPCPGMGQSPQEWHRRATPQQSEGKVVCRTIKVGESEELVHEVDWTVDSQLVSAYTRGNFDFVFQWWTAHYQ
jgi:hypothetical protein